MNFLRRLADRALGAAVPVRSQHAQRLRSGTENLRNAGAGHANDIADIADMANISHLAGAATEGHWSRTKPLAGNESDLALPLIADWRDGANRSDLALRHSDESSGRSPLPTTNRPEPRPSDILKAKPQEAGLPDPKGQQPAGRPMRPAPHFEPAASHRAARPPEDSTEPAPLLPNFRQAPSPSREALRHHDAAGPERMARRLAATLEAPAEVHVSIGRVELTALPPEPVNRAGPRRRQNERSLIDYLRGSADT